ncbi:reverse transcriptase domain-containing protein [Tanacetum coccineum]
MLMITLIGSSASLAYSIFPEFLKTQLCSEFFPLLLSEPQKDGWTNSPQELSIPGISSKKPLSKGIAHPPKPRSNLKIFTTSSRKETNHYIKPGNEESARRSTEMEVWIKKLQENADINSRNQNASLKNLETHIEQLTKEIHTDKTVNSSSGQIKIVTADQETSMLNKLHGVSLISETEASEALQHQLPPKELNPRSFILPCRIGKFNFYAMSDLGASINVMPRSMFEQLHLTNLKKTNMLCEMADMSKKAPLGIVENVLVKIDKFLFPSDFIINDNTPSETIILGRPFLATIHA